jgi:hypothetical protein
MSLLKISSLVVATIIGLGAASAATVHNGRGNFAREGSAVWHRYDPAMNARGGQGVYAGDEYAYEPLANAPTQVGQDFGIWSQH